MEADYDLYPELGDRAIGFLTRGYRWVSKRYAREFGKLHPGLVDTIFRYNNRHAKGRYLAKFAGTVPK